MGIAKVYIVSGLQPNGQCEFRLQGQCGFRLQCLVLPANWAVWIWTVGFSPASQLGSVDLDCRGSVDSDCSVCLSAKWCSVDSHCRGSVDSDCSVCLSAKWCSVDSHWLVIT